MFQETLVLLRIIKLKIMQNTILVTLKYQIATYSGEVQITCSEDTEDGDIKAIARERLKKISGGSLPFGYESFTILSKKNI